MKLIGSPAVNEQGRVAFYAFTITFLGGGVIMYIILLCSWSLSSLFASGLNGINVFRSNLLPDEVSNTDKYYHMWQADYAFFILAVISLGLAFFASLFIRKFYRAGIMTCSCSAVASLLGLVAAGLYTGVCVDVRNVSHKYGDEVYINQIVMAFSWTNVVIGLISTFFSLLSIPPELIPKQDVSRDSESYMHDDNSDKDEYSVDAKE